jgi:tetratricopeptide (TPR) repeat protein
MSYVVCKECSEKNPINALYCQECGRKLKINQELIDKILRMANEEVKILDKAMENKLKKAEDLTQILDFKIEFKDEQDINQKQKVILYTIIYENIMSDYNFKDDVKKGLAMDLIDSMEKQLMPNERIKILSKRINGNTDLAEKIENNETMKASILSSWAQDKARGASYFIVDFCNNKKCIDAFEDKIFDIDDVDNIPPIYSNCGCVPISVSNKAEAQKFNLEISQKNAEECKKYEEPYATGYIAFNLAEDKLKKYDKSNVKNEIYLDLIPLLKRALSDNISVNTKASVHRMVGDIYYKNGENSLAVTNYEKALSYNPKVGVKRLYDKLNKK